jgi:hypothetical protein
MARVLVLSFSNLGSDPRVDRQIEFLRARYEVVAAGLSPPRHRVSEFVELAMPQRTVGGKLLGGARLLARRYDRLYWTHPAHVTALELLRRVDVDVVVANDLNALPVAIRLGRPVVFDAHEYAPGQFADIAWWRLLIAPYSRWLSRHYIPQAASMTTVSTGIARAYERDTGVRPAVVTNAPPRANLAPTPVHEPIRLLHHGGAQPGRGLEEMVRVGHLLDDRFTLDFVLVESSSGYLDRLIRQSKGNPRIRFLEPWPMHSLVERANNYDIGMFLLPPINLQRQFALPNKFFEFVQARLAVAIGPSPEMASIVEGRACGIVADDFSPESLASAINGLTTSSIATFKEAADVAASELSAESNRETFLGLVDQALMGRPSSD